MITHPLALARTRPQPAGGEAATGALPALGLAMTSTALAVAGHHLVFARTASLAACLAVAQAAACCRFCFAASEPGVAGGTPHGGPRGAVDLAMTLVTVCALRTLACSRFRLTGMVQAGLRSLYRRLHALLSARTSTIPAVDPSRFSAARADDEERVSEVPLTGATGRRGPLAS
ncbi:hypothetical protein ACWC9X_15515 [Streptomyces asoensis]